VNHIDALLALLLVPFAVRGWRRGLCREGFALLGVVGGLVIAIATAPAAAARLAAAGVPELPAFPIALAGILVAVMLAARLLGALVARALRAVFLGGFDRTTGGAFGAIKGAACLGFLLLVLERLVPSPTVQHAIAGSLLGPPLMRVAAGALEFGREVGSAAREII
jgi:uncharacterized membrane protein required for colicin V production